MNGQTPLDYLDQIAPAAPPKKPLLQLNLRNIIIAGLALITLVVIIVNIANAIAATRLGPWQHLAARLSATAVVVDASTTKIKNSSLRGMNSDLKLYITNTLQEMNAGPLTNLGIDAAKLPASITKSEATTEMDARLEDGRLNAKYDSTYAREMTYQVATILALLEQIYDSGPSAETKTLIEGWYKNLEPTYTTLSDFSAANE